MVIDDLSQQKVEIPHRLKEQDYFVHLLDRLSAFMLDLLLLTPMLGFLFAPFYKTASEAYLGQLAEESFSVVALGVMTLFLFTFLYFALTTSLLGRTFGQKLCGQKVVHQSGRRLLLSESIKRESFWWGELLVLGWPLVSMLKDSQRRAPHDVLADCVVLSKKRVSAHHAMDRKFYWSFNVAYALVFLTLCAPLGLFVVKKAAGGFFHYAPQAGGCEQVRTLADQSRSELTRMDLALSLYAAGEVDEKCLGEEASYNLWRNHDTDVAYLSKAFSESEDSQLSDRYLKKVCEVAPTGVACRLSALVEKWSDTSRSELNANLSELSRGNEGFTKVWAARHYLSEGNYGEVLKMAQNFETEPGFASFAGRLKMKALLATSQVEKGADYFKSAWGLMTEDQRPSWSVTYCSQQLENKCSFEWKNQCDEYVNQLSLSEDWTENRDDLLTWSRQLRCADSDSLALLERSNWSESMRHYSSGVSFFVSRQYVQAIEQWEPLFDSGLDERNVLGLEAFRYWVWVADDHQLSGEIPQKLLTAKKRGPRWQLAMKALSVEYFARGFEQKSFELADMVARDFSFLEWPIAFKALQLLREGKKDEAIQLAHSIRRTPLNLIPPEGEMKRPQQNMKATRGLASLGHAHEAPRKVSAETLEVQLQRLMGEVQ